MKFTTEQIEKILETAMENCLDKEADETITRYMRTAFNNGVRMMMKETVYQLLMIESENLIKEASV